MSEFAEKVLAVVKQIPEGKVMSYKEVAMEAGSPKAYQAVGNILNKNRDPDIPCHRVIRANGRIGGYAFGEQNKIKILHNEGAIP